MYSSHSCYPNLLSFCTSTWNSGQKTEVPGGGELITYFQTVSGTETPFVSILKDTLGDSNPDNDELRDVWTFTYSRPSIFKRALAAVPFLYRRVGSGKASGVPLP